MNSIHTWNQIFNNNQVDNFVPLEQLEKKLNKRIFISASPNILFDNKYLIDESYDFYIILQTESFQTESVLNLYKQFSDRILILGNILSPDTELCLENPRFFYNWDWLRSPVYRKSPLHNLNADSRKYDFDCLIGRSEPLRDYFFELFSCSNLFKRSLYSYKKNNNIKQLDVENLGLIAQNHMPSTTIRDRNKHIAQLQNLYGVNVFSFLLLTKIFVKI